ncbi:MAG: trans-sulfuration enzyme family protein [Gemmatimonadota bacterium]
MKPNERPPRVDTLAVHAGRWDDREGAVVTPIYQSSTFDYPAGDRPLVYTRYGNNPSQVALQERLAALEGAEAALVLASGMGALATAILTVCASGDHVVAAPSLYGGTHRLLDVELPRLGMEVTYAEGIEVEQWREAIRPRTRLLLWEAISNPLLRVPDTPALAALAKERGSVSLVDATFATPINLRPIEHGVDLVMHSATKYLGGHSDQIGGVLAGPAGLVEEACHRMHSFGASIDPHAAFLVERGVKTLAVRMARHNDNGRRVAEFLSTHARVDRVHYPELPGHPDHAVAERLLAGGGGVVTFVPDASFEEAARLAGSFRWIRLAPSLGGVESLVSLPAQTSHRGLSREERAALGIPDPMIRLALGIEAADDLVEDLERALATL